MDLAQFRAAYRRAKGCTMSREAGHATQHANALRRVDRACHLAAEGYSLPEAAALLGMVPDSLRRALRAKLGSGAWPPCK